MSAAPNAQQHSATRPSAHGGAQEEESHTTSGTDRGTGIGRKRLADQVAECQKRWFVEAIEYAAQEADVVQMGLVGLMLQQGWGCERDPQEAAKWLAEAARRGAEMPAGYRLPADLPPPAQLAHLPPPGQPWPPGGHRPAGSDTTD